MMSHIQIVLSSIPTNQHFTASVIAILAYLRSVNSTLYENLSKRLYSVQEMITELENEFKNFFSQRSTMKPLSGISRSQLLKSYVCIIHKDTTAKLKNF